MNDKRIVSGSSRNAAGIWIAIAISAIAAMAYLDVFAEGLKATLIYRIIGYGVYPVYYGCWLYVIYRMYLMNKGSQTYISIEDGNLVILDAHIMKLVDIKSVYSRRNVLFLKELVIENNENEKKILKAYFLDRPVDDVIFDLRKFADLS